MWDRRVGGAVAVVEDDGMTGNAPTKRSPTVVWATDGSRASLAAGRVVRGVCEPDDSALYVVHIAPALATRAHERRIAALRAATSSLRRHGINASLHVVRGAIGPPARHIADVARMVDADLLIVTTRGRSPLAGAVAGSVSQRLLACAPCPVLVVPPAAISAAVPSYREVKQPAA